MMASEPEFAPLQPYRPVELDVLRMPSAILANMGVSTLREYASVVFRCTQQMSSAENQAFAASFKHAQDSDAFAIHVRERVNRSIPCSDAEECILLPPLFLRSCENAIYELGSQLFLIAYRNGPVIPVVRVRLHSSSGGDPPTSSSSAPPSQQQPQTPAAAAAVVVATAAGAAPSPMLPARDQPAVVIAVTQAGGDARERSSDAARRTALARARGEGADAPPAAAMTAVPAADANGAPARALAEPTVVGAKEHAAHEATASAYSSSAPSSCSSSPLSSSSALPDFAALPEQEQARACFQLAGALQQASKSRWEHDLLLAGMDAGVDAAFCSRALVEDSLVRANQSVQHALRGALHAKSHVAAALATAQVTRRLLPQQTAMLDERIAQLTTCLETLGAALGGPAMIAQSQ